MTRGMGDEGQVHTMEGVIAGLILVLTLMYITSSISLVSPQTQKEMVMKQGIKAADILNSLAVENSTATIGHNPLTDAVALWNGNVPDMDSAVNSPVNSAELSIMGLNISIDRAMKAADRHNNSLYTMYNVYLIYTDASGNYINRPIILHGEPSDYDNAASASKIVILNKKNDKSSYWEGFDMPKAIEVRLVLWSV